MSTKSILLLYLIVLSCYTAYCQEVPVLNYSVDDNGQVLLEVNSSSDKYYILQVRHHPDSSFSQLSSMTYGQEGSTIITEPLKAYPLSHYRVLEYDTSSAFDSDGDGIDDVLESQSMPINAPLNAAESISMEHGLISLDDLSAFQTVSTHENTTPWIGYLDDIEYTKFIILDFFTDSAQLYFINCNTHPLHSSFSAYMGFDHTVPSIRKGQMMYNPSALASNGTLGTYTFNFSSSIIEGFPVVQRTQEIIAANMPYLTNNLSYFLTENDEELYAESSMLYQNSRVSVIFESDVYAGVNYWGLNQAESYGYFRLMAPGEIPGPRDIVLYEVIPNALPHVGGVITSVFQTPLSHVNLRAIQDNIPNAFIRNPLEIDSISNLLGHYIHFKTNQSSYEITEATVAEVNDWYESIRPLTEQSPPLNLAYTQVLPLDSIEFYMFDGFGAKTANVSTMRTFGFAPGTIPDGFGIPFYFYQEFMEHNHFFEEIEGMLLDSEFMADRNVRDARLAQLRAQIKLGEMPQWMLDSFENLHNAFPTGTSIRCRSSTNNEDLPGFSGAGLYDSKTHHSDEGHLSKTIKQVFASLWNLRAFDEREFYRINHFNSSMGVLCHSNFEDELVNGVGVSTDPIYATDNTFYLNSQLGEELITNPGTTLPEELLIDRFANSVNDYLIIQYSSLIDEDTLLMSTAQIDLLRQYLSEIHAQFEDLYDAEGNDTFAMDIEYKITSDEQLIIKQARPWVTFTPVPKSVPSANDCGNTLFPNPANNFIFVGCENCGIATIQIFNLKGEMVIEQSTDLSNNSLEQIVIDRLTAGVYVVKGFSDSFRCDALKFIKH